MACPDHANNPTVCSALIKCPYNEEHHVSPKLFAQHLRDCRREYCMRNASSIKYVRCKLNSRHHVPEIELAFHERHCDDSLFNNVMGTIHRRPVEVPVDSEEDSSSSSSDSDSDTESSSSAESADNSISTDDDPEDHHRRYKEDV